MAWIMYIPVSGAHETGRLYLLVLLLGTASERRFKTAIAERRFKISYFILEYKDAALESL